MKKLLSIFLWFPVCLITLIFTLSFLSYHQHQQLALNQSELFISQIPYNFYSSIPKVLGAKTLDSSQIQTNDIIPQLIYDYLASHHSPMLESTDSFVTTARKYEIDPLFVLSIAQCESNLGKKMPHKSDDPYECHNPFGWGIHQRGTLCFDSWEKGYEVVFKGLKEKYFDKGYQTTEEIMTKYTPAALEKEGSWAKCVNYFLKKLDQKSQSYL